MGTKILVIPAQAGIQEISSRAFWIPAFAGMTICASPDRNEPS
jgi:uncharacterized protein YgiB involved in biofilm formation